MAITQGMINAGYNPTTSGFGMAPIKSSGGSMGISSGGYGTYAAGYPPKPVVNTKELVLEWIMTYGHTPVKLDAFMNKNPKFAYIDNKYLDKTEDMEEYALNSFADSLLAE